MSTFRSTIHAFAALLSVVSVPASALVIYENAPQSPVTSPRTSQFINDVSLFGFQTFDDFTLNSGVAITDVHWRGAYFNFVDPNAVAAANATGFGVRFYADDSGLPGALLASAGFSPAAANQSFVGTQSYTAGATTVTLGIYDYDVILGAPLVLAANTKYWLSVFAFSPAPSATQAQWSWVGGIGGDDSSVQTNGFDPAFLRIAGPDRAFALTTIPEPGTLLLSAGALVLLLGVVRRQGRQRD